MRRQKLIDNIETIKMKMQKEHPELYRQITAVNVNLNNLNRTALKSYMSTLGQLLHQHIGKRYVAI